MNVTAAGGEMTTRVDPRSLDIRTASATGAIVIIGTILLGRLAAVAGAPELTLLASAVPAGSGFIYAYLHGRRGAGGLLPSGVVPFSGFELAWPVMAVLGALIVLGVGNLGSFVGAVVSGTIEGALSASLIAAVAASFAIGRWIGVRANVLPYVAVLLAAYGGRALASLLDYALLDPQLRDTMGIGLNSDYVVAIAIGGTIWAAAGVIGCWMGRRAREAGYLSYLLKRLDPETRHSVIQLVFDESRRS